MKLSVRLLLTAVLLAGSCNNLAAADEQSSDRPVKDKWAVVIGIGKFASPKIPTLKFPAKDAQDFYNFLISKGNFSKDHVLLLKDEKATKVSILDAFGDGWLPRRVLEDDLVVVFISSHGSPADVAGENFIIAHDSDPDHTYATGIRLQDLSSELTKRTGCDRIVLLLDACHSGAAVLGQKGLTRGGGANFNLDSVAGVGQMVISSSSPDETSWESKRYPNGVFTHHLIDALGSAGTKTAISQAYQQLRDNVQQEVRFDRVTKQTPMLLSKWKGADLALCAPAAAPRNVLPSIGEEVITATAASPPAQPVKQSNNQTAQIAANALPNNSYTRSTMPVPPAPKQVQPGAPTGANTVAAAMMRTDWCSNGGDATLESGTTIIRAEDLASLSRNQLELLYNEAYARHGRGFMRRDIQQYFDSQPWYKRDSDYHYRPDDPRVLSRKGMTDDPLVINEKRTPKQWANMQTIKRAMDGKR